ncbi:MAG TPA: hypothetical protein VFY65_01830 [Longimicrobium sp.]|nr:hypothetical protein [Longimicrobium sp.]
MKLNPEELDVTSFDTTPAAEPGSDAAAVIEPILPATTSPTAATRCFICPPITYGCW